MVRCQADVSTTVAFSDPAAHPRTPWTARVATEVEGPEAAPDPREPRGKELAPWGRGAGHAVGCRLGLGLVRMNQRAWFGGNLRPRYQILSLEHFFVG